MTNEPSPRPWHTANFINGIEDANNGKVAANIRDADAALIVDAVNFYDATVDTQLTALLAERDRLRDIVRRLVGYCEAVTVYRPPVVEVRGSDGTHDDYNGAELLREARAAIGEDKP